MKASSYRHPLCCQNILTIYLSMYLFIYQSIYLSIYLSKYLFIYLSIYIFFPVLSHHYPSIVGALLCIKVSSLSWPVYTIITVTPPYFKFCSWYCFYRLQGWVVEFDSKLFRLHKEDPIYLGYIPFLLRERFVQL